MIDSLGPNDGPSRITMCTEDGILTGFQVFYGSFNEIAGSAHGDLSTECTNTEINAQVESVAIYGSTSGQYVEGMAIALQPFTDEEYPGVVVEAGLTNQVGQKKRLVHIATNQGDKDFFEFFGFRT